MPEELDDGLTEKVQTLSDIELAVLICLVADQHCIIEAEKEAFEDLQQELQLVRGCYVPAIKAFTDRVT